MKRQDEDVFAVDQREALGEQREGRRFTAAAAAGQPNLPVPGDRGKFADEFVDDNVLTEVV